MTDILAQIGDKLGAKIKQLQAQIDAGGGGGSGAGHSHDPVDSYTEPTFSDGVLVSTATYTSYLKTTSLGSKAFSYNAEGLLIQVVERDGSDALYLTKTITYDSNGNLESITKDYA